MLPLDSPMKASRSPSPSMSAKAGVESDPMSTPSKGFDPPVRWVKVGLPLVPVFS